MEPIRKGLWYIESHFASPLGLDEIAGQAGLSRFHFSRTFAQVTGVPVLAYVRGRRLSQAARMLAKGAPDILSVALESGYGSHEAFTRAFRDFLGVTPEDVRAGGTIENLKLLEPFVMSDLPATTLPAPQFREEGPFLMGGLREYRTFEERAGIPEQWQRFLPHFGNTSGQIGRDAFGICLAPSRSDDGFDYMTAVAVRSADELPEQLSAVHIARRRYAVFRHEGHVSQIGATCAAISRDWQPRAAVEIESAPLFMIERYDSSFDPQTGFGGMEVWIPLKAGR